MTDGRTDGQTDGRTDGQTDGRTDGGDCNIPIAFLKKRGDKYVILTNMTDNEMYPPKYWYMRAINLFAYEFKKLQFWTNHIL